MGAAFGRTLEIAEVLGDTEYQLRALSGLHYCHIRLSQYRAALAFGQRFYDLAISGADPYDRLYAERTLGVTKHFLGDQVSARGHLERALTDDSATDHRLDFIRFQSDLRVSTRIYLARVLWLLGFVDQAMRIVEESIEKARITDDANSLCLALAMAACPLALSIGDLSAAARYAQMLRDHAREHNLPLWGGYGAMHQSVVSIKKGDREAIEFNLSFSSLTTQIELVDALVQAGRIPEGLASVEAGIELSDGAWARPELQRLKGELLLLQNGKVSAEPAADLFGQALSGARAQEALSWELRAATSLARLLRNQGRPAEAIACLQPVYDRFTEGFGTVDLIAAKHLLDDLASARRD